MAFLQRSGISAGRTPTRFYQQRTTRLRLSDPIHLSNIRRSSTAYVNVAWLPGPATWLAAGDCRDVVGCSLLWTDSIEKKDQKKQGNSGSEIKLRLPHS